MSHMVEVVVQHRQFTGTSAAAQHLTPSVSTKCVGLQTTHYGSSALHRIEMNTSLPATLAVTGDGPSSDADILQLSVCSRNPTSNLTEGA